MSESNEVLTAPGLERRTGLYAFQLRDWRKVRCEPTICIFPRRC